MEHKLLILLILTGIVPLVLCVPLKFYLIQQLKSWTDAQSYCRTNHIDLATIPSAADMNLLQTVAQEQQFTSTAWVGLNKVYHDLRWSLDNAPVGTMRPWTPGEPDNYGGWEDCGGLVSTGWADGWCPWKAPFICFDETKSGTDRYIYYNTTLIWNEAQLYCRQHHTDLTSSRDPTENSIVVGLVSGWTWFGLHRSTWSWSDQNNITYVSWGPNQPDNYNQLFCAYVLNGLTYDASCADLRAFFCYRVITGQKQIIRIKIQSNLDVNDPVVKAAILKMIKEKLSSSRLENVTVNFREQSGGNVFQKLRIN